MITMKGCSRLLCPLLLPLLIALCSASTLLAKTLTDPEIATKLHISVQDLHGLRDRFGFTDLQLLKLDPFDLQGLLDQLTRPGIDKHAEELNFRALHLRDENGQIPIDGLSKAMKEK